MDIRKSHLEDIPDIMKLVHQAQNYFKESGIDQWQDGYPQDINIQNDIDKQCSYVLFDKDIIGTMYFTLLRCRWPIICH